MWYFGEVFSRRSQPKKLFCNARWLAFTETTDDCETNLFFFSNNFLERRRNNESESKNFSIQKILEFFLPKKAFYGLTSIFCEGQKKESEICRKNKFLEFSPK